MPRIADTVFPGSRAGATAALRDRRLMRSTRQWFGVCAALTALCFVGWLAAAPATPAEPSDARTWLLRIHEAAGSRNFQGIFVVTSGGAASSARIAHFSVGDNQYERIESLDGRARQVYRHNDVVHTFWPQKRTVLVEQRERLRAFPALLHAGDDHIAQYYDVRSEGTDRVAGRLAHVLELRPRDAYRYGYRLWSDSASGLLLRSDVTGERGEVLASSAFSEVSIGVRSQPESVLQPMRRTEGLRVVRPALVPTRLEDQGWTLRNPVPGFRQVSSVRRPLESPADPSGGEPRPADMLQAIYADGLAYVSVFIEPFDPARHGQPMLTVSGATHTLTRRQGDAWITAVGDVPGETLRLFARGIERTR